MGSTNAITLDSIEITIFFVAILLLLVAAHLCGYLFQLAKLPRVIGEICGGILLGPSFLGLLSHTGYQWIFNSFSAEGKLLSAIYWLGLVLLMFISGFEVQKSLSAHDNRLIIAMVIGSTIIPLLVGWFVPEVYDFSRFLGVKRNIMALRVIIAIAIAVTSIPVISKIFMDLGMLQTRFAKVVLATATIHDVILWVGLAVVTAMVGSKSIAIGQIIATVGVTIVFFIIALLFMPRLIEKALDSERNILMRSSAPGFALFVCFFFACMASCLDVNIVFGAFLAGILIGNIKDKKLDRVKENIKEFSLAFFVPIYFAIVGLKLDLIHQLDIGFFLGFLAFTTVFQILGTILAARSVQTDWFSGLNLGIAMNAKGGPGIILATIAFDLGIINETFFTTLVVTAIITSLFAGYWFKYILAKGRDLLPEDASVPWTKSKSVEVA